MKRLSIILSALFVISLALIACNEDEKTELGWINGSSGAINDIMWADGDATWTKGEDGYAYDEQTESKEVNELTGGVECALDTTGQGDFAAATVSIPEEDGADTLALNEGESYVYTIEAEAK